MTALSGTETYAANLALAICGVPAIADMSVNTTAGRAVRLFFPSVRDALLRKKWWSFAKGWARPAADTVESIGPLKIRYPLPADCVRVRYIVDGDGETYDEGCGEWDIESGAASAGQAAQTFLVTNIEGVTIAYTRRIEEVRLWDPVFLEGFARALAAPISKKLGRSGGFADRLEAKAAEIIDTAAGIDSKEQSKKKAAPGSSWLAARSSGFRRGI